MRGVKRIPIIQFVLLALACFPGVSFSQTPALALTGLYAPGHFPTGRVFQVEDLEGLIDVALERPSYLIGKFLFVGRLNGVATFVNFVPEDIGRNERGEPIPPRVLVLSEFPGGFPPALAKGKILNATPDNPLTLLKVTRSDSPDFPVVVEAQSQSEP